MKNEWKYFLFLIWLTYLVVASTLFFTQGFLLTRITLNKNSSCLSLEKNHRPATVKAGQFENESFSAVLPLPNILEACKHCQSPKARIILVIVDALRYDFTTFNKSVQDPLPFQNKLPIISKLLSNQPNSSRLYKFVADPPTTTMQRLKALTTGSLPTFIDAGSNFASSEITEDNLIDQIIKQKKNVVFMGDDTWCSLFPERFLRQYPFPSFNVQDLDTVDNGIKSKLFEEIKQRDWSLLISHFLGVDHCGHTFGPYHSEMSRKLMEINEVIENVTIKMENDQILYVIGDHGMTITGDHGGETELETTAAFFVYSKQPLLNFEEYTDTTKQVNIVPTIATVLGVPIPFSNLGSILFNAIPQRYGILTEKQLASTSMMTNVFQIVDYLKEYSKTSGLFNEVLLEDFYKRQQLLITSVVEIGENDFKTFFKFIQDIRTMCEQHWTQFDLVAILGGLVTLLFSLVFVVLTVDVQGFPELFKTSSLLSLLFFSFTSVTVISTVIHGLFQQFKFSILFFTIVVSQILLTTLIVQKWNMITFKCLKIYPYKLFCRLNHIVLVFMLFGLLSNSYIIEEQFVLFFITETVCVVSFVRLIKNVKLTLQLSKFKLVLVSIGVLIMVRFMTNFWRCRNEQVWCLKKNFEMSIADKDISSNTYCMTLFASLIFIVLILKRWIINCGNLNGFSLNVISLRYAPTIMAISIEAFWVMKRSTITKNKVLLFETDYYFAWIVYSLFGIGILSVIINPLMIFMMHNPPRSKQIPKLFKELCLNNTNEERRVPVIYGLSTVYSAGFIAVAKYMVLLFVLLLGEKVAPSALIMFLTSFLVLLLSSVLRINQAKNFDDLLHVPSGLILLWTILSHGFFYGSGHQTTFSSINWNVAFIGIPHQLHNIYLQATLVILNTFCSYIIMGLILPLLLIAPFTVLSQFVQEKVQFFEDDILKGEMLMFERKSIVLSELYTTSCKYIGFHGVRVFTTMLSATIHCRHLMVWNIFAPMFIFESIAFFVTLISVLCGYLFLQRINYKINKNVIS